MNERSTLETLAILYLLTPEGSDQVQSIIGFDGPPSKGFLRRLQGWLSPESKTSPVPAFVRREFEEGKLTLKIITRPKKRNDR